MPANATEDRPETKGRPTLYKGIQMRSRLEADYAASLDRRGALWEYEPVCFAADGLQWLPDFRTGNAIYVELKPAALLRQERREKPLIDRIDALLTRMSVAWLSKPDVSLNLIFWTYGVGFEFGIVGSRDIPWRTWDDENRGVPLLWSGMGQRAALPTAPESARALRGVTAGAR